MLRNGFIFVILFLCFANLFAMTSTDLIGTAAPGWNNQKWINSQPLTLADLKGKVVLLRFFMESACPFCRASAPYLNQFHDKYKDQPFVVIGMYTPKPSPAETPLETVRGYVEDYGFKFPVALDNDWATLKSFWLDRVRDADYTSVSFLIDKQGIVRYIHPGGAYSDDDAANIERHIQHLLSR